MRSQQKTAARASLRMWEEPALLSSSAAVTVQRNILLTIAKDSKLLGYIIIFKFISAEHLMLVVCQSVVNLVKSDSISVIQCIDSFTEPPSGHGCAKI